MNASLKDWALYYAEKGLAVFPLEERGKRPITKNGCKAATTNKEQIAEWWSCYPNSNIGIATGRPSGGLVVIDLDEDEEKLIVTTADKRIGFRLGMTENGRGEFVLELSKSESYEILEYME